jgi:hypothetical protein
MANPSDSTVQNLLPVQAYFDVNGNFQTFIGQGQPFYATLDPQQSGLNITNSTINSTTIGVTTPAVGYFTSGYVSVAPTTATGIANKQYVDYYAAGLSWKQPVKAASLSNIASLSGFQTIDTVPLTDGDRILVKDQSLSKDNGIYVVRSGAWEYAVGADDWQEYVGAIVFVEEGSQAYSAWYSLAQEGGTLGVTALNWANFSVSSTYSAGTGLTLSAGVFSITNTGVINATYGSASKTVTLAINAQGQATSASQQDIAIAATQITSGTIDSARLSGSYSGITGLGTLGNLTVTNTISGSINGNAATATSATSATTATNLAGGAIGNVPYQTASGATAFLATGSNGQVLTLASGIPSWATPTTGTVTSVSGTGTVSGITLSGTVTSTGSLTLGGSLDLSSPPAIGGTTANTVRGTTITATSSFVGTYFDASGSGGGQLRNASGVSQLAWGSGGGSNLSLEVATNINPANAAVSISPTGTGTVAISPAGALTINPTTASTMNNVAIGGTTALAGTFTTLRVNSTISLAGSTGTSGFVLTSNGASAPTWSALPASSITITDDTSTNATRYLTFTSATSGSITGENVSSTKLQFNPSTGVLTATEFSGSGASLTGLTAGNLSGTIPSGVLGNSSLFIGTTSIALNRASASQALTGITSIDGSAASVANALTVGTGLKLSSGTTYNGSSALTINAVGTTINSQTTGYTLVAGDAGKTISITTGGVTVNNSVNSAGDIVTIYNNSGSSQTITQGAGVTLQWAGQSSSTTGNRTLGLYGIATIIFISSSNAVITGSGLT